MKDWQSMAHVKWECKLCAAEHNLSLYTNQTDDLIQKQVSPQPLHIVYAPLGQVSNTVIDFLPV